jgi:death-on-curing protein
VNGINWLTSQDVADITERLVADSGETFFIRDTNALEGAVQYPQNKNYYDGEEDMVRLACYLMFAVGQAHAFEQGNKRAAFTSGQAFLEINGYDLNIPDIEAAAALFVAFITHEVPFEVLENYVREFTTPQPDQAEEPDVQQEEEEFVHAGPADEPNQ